MITWILKCLTINFVVLVIRCFDVYPQWLNIAKISAQYFIFFYKNKILICTYYLYLSRKLYLKKDYICFCNVKAKTNSWFSYKETLLDYNLQRLMVLPKKLSY